MASCFGEGGIDAQTRRIDKELKKERIRLRKQIKILLLGTGESGKSTFIKQMIIIHGAGEFNATDVRIFRLEIYNNIITAMITLLVEREKLNYQWENPSREEQAESVRRIMADHFARSEIDQVKFREIAPLIRELWDDGAVKRVFDQRHLFQINDSCIHFFENINRIAAIDYYPTNRDILLCRKSTKAINEHLVEIDKIPFRFIDVGGFRSQRHKWVQCFDNVTCILFMVASNEYDQTLIEDDRTNRVMEACILFGQMVNHKALEKVFIILFMNKSDLLEQKLPRSDIRQYFFDFRGNERSLKSVQNYLLDKFDTVRRNRKEPLFCHFTTAIDTENVRKVFGDCQEAIRERNMDGLMM